MLDLAVEADDETLLEDVQAELDSAEQALGNLEFRRMFSNPMDPNPCFLEIYCGCICVGSNVMALKLN